MSTVFLPSIIASGFGVAFFHAAIPSHWLPFVLAGRGQHWGHGKTLAVTGLAGLGHVLFTTVLGVLVVWGGIETSHLTGNVFPFIAGGVLILFGLYYLSRWMRGDGHGHHHWFAEGHDHEHHHDHRHDHDHSHADHLHGSAPASVGHKSDAAVILSLLAVLTFSPCEGFLPVYLSGISYGWSGFLLLSGVLAAATLAGMVTFTWLTLAGLKRLKFAVLERYENAILGSLLVFLGIAVLVFEK